MSLVRNFALDQPVPNGGLTLNIVITQNTESQAGDATFNFEDSSGITDFNFLFGDNDILLGYTVVLAEGITEAALVIDTFADDILETDEIGTITLADGENYRANPNQFSTATIFTDRTVVTLTTSEVNVTEGETFAWNFSLNRPAPEGGLTLSLPITLNNDPAPGDVIYDVEGSTNISDFGFITDSDVSVGFTLTIPEGETEATLVSEAVVDDVAEFDEIFTTVLADGLDYVANPASNQVVTTIVEDGVAPASSAPVVSITPQALITTEGETFAWDFSLDQPVPEGGLTLTLPITQNNDPAPGDVIYNVEGSTGIADFDFIVEDDISIGFSVTLEEGVTSATLVSEAVVDDDDIEEFADEIFTTVLADGVDYRANPDSNEVQTFITGQTVVSFTPEQVQVAEGDTFAWNFSLNQPAPNGGLTLSLPITFNNDPAPGDVEYNVNGSSNITDFSFLVVDDISVGFNVTIAEGETQATLVSEAVADGIAEGDEIFTTILNDGADYRANPLSKEVVTTIVEQDSSATGDETVVGDEGDNILDGKDGDDTVAGGLGNDEILGGDGSDVLRGDLNSRSPGGTVGGDDTISGGAGNDRIGGKAGNDELFGDEGNDQIYGDDGDDLIRGGLGNDVLIGDDFSGGSGADTFVLAAGEGSDTIIDFEVGTDIIGLADGLTVEDLTVTASSSSTTIALGDETLAVLEGVVSGSEIDYAVF
ncbi:MAG: calcium-binding protein [Microcoleaceae cyanobacterium]